MFLVVLVRRWPLSACLTRSTWRSSSLRRPTLICFGGSVRDRYRYRAVYACHLFMYTVVMIAIPTMSITRSNVDHSRKNSQKQKKNETKGKPAKKSQLFSYLFIIALHFPARQVAGLNTLVNLRTSRGHRCQSFYPPPRYVFFHFVRAEGSVSLLLVHFHRI